MKNKLNRFQSEIKVPVTKKEFESFLRKAKLEHLGN